uniref:radical SAM family heme chaperone HemW n=1 Tax=Parerythrobacter lutipelagi TaxID=1964208 RepID=UPI0010F86E14|nr:radical SAM family heme chaperone HemW [Parerythrobacter lutipelagi]
MARALYIHWPFCLKKCPYCDFNSHVRAEVDHALWERAMLADMRHEHVVSDSGPLTSIFFGGGTPSLMPPGLVARLLVEAEQLWGFDPGIEITLEANPSSVEAGKFADLNAAGVNRVSLGLQSLDDRTLGFLGRLHSVEESLEALGIAQRVFERVSFDLIYARPKQSEAQWRAELARALSFGTQHLSLYQLTIEPGTRFATDVRRGVFSPLEDDPAADLFAVTQEMTSAAGLPAYEISNHAAAGQESRHNLTYWRYQDYAGIGPGAHGRRAGCATQRHKKPENWLSAIEQHRCGLSEERPLVPAEAATEALLMGLRLREGIDLTALGQRFDLRRDALVDQERLDFYRNLGFVWERGGRIGATQAGMGVLDALLGELVASDLVAS